MAVQGYLALGHAGVVVVVVVGWYSGQGQPFQSLETMPQVCGEEVWPEVQFYNAEVHSLLPPRLFLTPFLGQLLHSSMACLAHGLGTLPVASPQRAVASLPSWDWVSICAVEPYWIWRVCSPVFSTLPRILLCLQLHLPPIFRSFGLLSPAASWASLEGAQVPASWFAQSPQAQPPPRVPSSVSWALSIQSHNLLSSTPRPCFIFQTGLNLQNGSSLSSLWHDHDPHAHHHHHHHSLARTAAVASQLLSLLPLCGLPLRSYSCFLKTEWWGHFPDQYSVVTVLGVAPGPPWLASTLSAAPACSDCWPTHQFEHFVLLVRCYTLPPMAFAFALAWAGKISSFCLWLFWFLCILQTWAQGAAAPNSSRGQASLLLLPWDSVLPPWHSWWAILMHLFGDCVTGGQPVSSMFSVLTIKKCLVPESVSVVLCKAIWPHVSCPHL